MGQLAQLSHFIVLLASVYSSLRAYDVCVLSLHYLI